MKLQKIHHGNYSYLFLLVVLVGMGCANNQVRGPSDERDWGDYEIAEPAKRSEIQTTSFYLTMRDGVKIAVDLHLPKDLPAGTKLPTIFRATRYVRSFELRWPFSVFVWPKKEPVQRFLGNGYAWIDVDARGSGASFGTREGELSADEIEDYGEVIDWITSQPWSDGNVGATGISYDGSTAELLLTTGRPAVKAIATRFSFFDIQSDIALIDGIHLSSFTEKWQIGNSAMDRNAIHEVIGDWKIRMAVIGTRPVDNDEDRKLLAAAVAEHADNFNIEEGMQYVIGTKPWPENTITSLTDLSPAAYIDKFIASDAAIYSYAGWFDGAYARSAIRRFVNVDKSDHRILLGPWTHGGRYDASPLAQRTTSFDHDMELLRFFDHYLKGVATGLEDELSVRYFTMVENSWKSAETWPPPANPVKFYLAPEGVLSQNQPDSSGGYDRYEVNYEVGTGIHARWDTTLTGGQVTYSDRAEQDASLLTYTTAPLQSDKEVAQQLQQLIEKLRDEGKPEYRFTLSLLDSEVPNAFVIPGGHIFITSGLLRLVDSENGLAMVLAHEMGHQYQRHPLRSLGRGAVIALALMVVSGAEIDALVESFVGNAAVLTSLGFSREQEHEADRLGIALLTQHYGHASGSVEFFEALKGQPYSDSDTPEFFSTHPGVDERIDLLRAHSRQSSGDKTALPGAIQSYLESIDNG